MFFAKEAFDLFFIGRGLFLSRKPVLQTPPSTWGHLISRSLAIPHLLSDERRAPC